MAVPDPKHTRQTIVDEFDVLDYDIHVADDGSSLTFYVPIDQLDQARKVLDSGVKVLETHEHECPAKASL